MARLTQGPALLHTRCGEAGPDLDTFSYRTVDAQSEASSSDTVRLCGRQVLWNIDSPADTRVGQAVLITHWEFEDGTRGGPGAPVDEGELEPAGRSL